MHNLSSALILLSAAVLAVVLCRSIKLPPILGYLLVGIIIGPANLGLIPNSTDVNELAEFGVVFLMFSIGLEFSLPQLKAMRHLVFGLGTAQVIIMMGVAPALGWATGLGWQAGLVIGGIFAMSSTAIVSKILSERVELNTPQGRQIMGVLLFQDLAVVPLIILIPALATQGQAWIISLSVAAVKAAIILSILLVFGQKVMRNWLHLVAKQRSSELFVINILFITLGIAYLTELAGLSLALGAFVTGMLISETEFRYQVEEDIKPFRDVLLGLFFVTIGMKLDLQSVAHHIGWVALAVFFLVPLKFMLIAGLSRLFTRSAGVALRTGLALAQAGEFGFVLLTLGAKFHLLNALTEQVALAAMLISMLVAPFLIQSSNWLVNRFCGSEWLAKSANLHSIAVQTMASNNHVVLCGYGRTGQNVARFLEQENITFFALDLDPERVREAAAAGESVVYGDAAKREVLIAAGLMRAAALVITYDDTESALRILSLVHELRQKLPVLVRTQDDSNFDKLKAAGAMEVVVMNMEGTLMLASHALMLLGVPLNRVLKHIRQTREQRYHLLRGIFHGKTDDPDEASDKYQPRLHSVSLPREAASVGKTLGEINLASYEVEVKAVRRHNIRGKAPAPDTCLEEGDVLVLLGTPEGLAVAEMVLLQGR